MATYFSTLNPQQRRDLIRQRERRDEYVNRRKDAPCMDCGIKYPPNCMDFDHVRGKKYKNVSQINTVKLARAEIKKCDLVCANCHRTRTAKRIENSKARVKAYHEPDPGGENWIQFVRKLVKEDFDKKESDRKKKLMKSFQKHQRTKLQEVNIAADKDEFPIWYSGKPMK